MYGGTGFFVKHIDEQGNRGTYFVTAKHVAEGVRGRDFVLRMGSVKEEIRNAKWHYLTDDPSVDIAVLEYAPPADAGVVRFPTKHFITPFKVGTKRIGPGDQAHIVGLYRLHPGEQRNRVVVHTGHVAMMPDADDRFSIKGLPEPVEGYAVEAQTLEGLSGSPVFVRRSIMVKPIEHTGVPPLAYGAIFLLGIWIASWEGVPDEVLANQLTGTNRQEGIGPSIEQQLKVPVGMGVVAPAYDILRVLEIDELKESRRSQRKDTT